MSFQNQSKTPSQPSPLTKGKEVLASMPLGNNAGYLCIRVRITHPSRYAMPPPGAAGWQS